MNKRELKEKRNFMNASQLKKIGLLIIKTSKNPVELFFYFSLYLFERGDLRVFPLCRMESIGAPKTLKNVNGKYIFFENKNRLELIAQRNVRPTNDSL